MRVLLSSLAAAAALAAPAAAHALTFAPCGQPDGICATLTVPLDRSGIVPGTVRLFVEKRPTTAMPRQGVLLWLPGGPGSTGTGATAQVAEFYVPLLPGHDVVVMDYRGVGLSDPLSCRAPRDRAACGLELGPRRHFYATRDIVEDIEALRQALGVDKLVIDGGSYGTKIAQGYARRYGERIELLMLDGVIPVDGWDPWARNTYRAIPRVLRSLCSGGQCRGVTSDPVRDLQRLIARAGRDPLPVRFVEPNGRVARGELRLQRLFRIYYQDLFFEAATRARVPAAVAAYLRGDPFPLGRMYRHNLAGEPLTAPHGPPQDNDVAWAATMCEDLPLPWRGETLRERKIDRAVAELLAIPPSVFAPFPKWSAAATPLIVSCLDWPSGPMHPTVVPRIRYTGPTLVLGGEHDLRTPVEDAATALTEFPQATLVVVPAGSHGVDWTRCGRRAIAEFLARRQPPQCQPARSPTPPAPLPPTSLSRVAPWPGVAGRRGRTIRAVVETVRDVGYTVWGSAPRVGLRGGTFTTTEIPQARATLRRIVYVPGVVVSGRFDDVAHTATVTVSGSGSRGTLRITARSITGRLDGRPVRARGASLVIRGPDNR